ncbi:ABC transporter permease [Microbacterium pseudoresistens]|uniref:Ribose/xylose/arabinose/galactoside ABC-type transport system permease subunit n=1 Tax=Microbacterium pseudoresistens TaxID=640634 RepID=A0A7Y9JPB2_9MICO|nr:ABC transporter permease [Microbacterium pseudoresistens]NYD54489.1 ribose/xylose/arabinose/galactoside ABC-type transport system permease subunit [Microbacterium pseudoresistens]
MNTTTTTRRLVEEEATTASMRPVMDLLRNRAFLGIVVLLLLVAFFAWQLPETYLTVDNMKSILQQQSTLIVLALGVTFVLMIGEFDLSFSFTIGLSAAVSILLMSALGVPWLVAILAGIIIGMLVGVANGLAVAWGRAPAFIATLAVGSAATGIEQLLTGNNTIANGVPVEYLMFTLEEFAGLPSSVWLTLLLVAISVFIVSFTTFGRRVRATGLNPTAVALAGTSVERVRLGAFVIMGLLAGLAGVMVSSLGGSYFPNSGSGLLLPPYSAVFLGAAIIGRGRFSPLATLYGFAFIALLERGLTMMNQKSAVIMLIEGLVLLVAVVLARQERKR